MVVVNMCRYLGDDGSCEMGVLGCTDIEATNHDPLATVDDGSCTYGPAEVYGCMNKTATNYNPLANIDDGTCVWPPPPPPEPPPGIGFMAVELVFDNDSGGGSVDIVASAWIIDINGNGNSNINYPQYVGSSGSGNYTYSWVIDSVTSSGINSNIIQSNSTWSVVVEDVVNGYVVSFSGVGVPSGLSILTAIS